MLVGEKILKKIKAESGAKAGSSILVIDSDDELNDEVKEFSDISDDDIAVYNMPLWRRMCDGEFQELPFGGLAPIVPEKTHTGKRGRGDDSALS